jgi:ubiquitin carboxyl-terminal hydrolase 7
VFYKLQFSDESVDTKKLTKSLGFTSEDVFLQKDVQEFSRGLLEMLENKMTTGSADSTISNLFKGITRSYVRCTDVEFESSLDEIYFDIQLMVTDRINRKP